MQVTFATLADYAMAHPDGRFYITGADIQSLAPGQYQRLSLAVRIRLDEDDLGRERPIEITSVGPGGEPFVKPFKAVVKAPAATPADGSPATFPFVYNIEEVRLQVAGEHCFLVSSDGVELARVSFVVTPEVNVAPAQTTGWQAELDQATALYNAGDLALAIARLNEIVTRYPDLAVAHNNLGFVLLTAGRVNEGLSELVRARELNFDRTELLFVNLAVAYYLSGVYAEAVSLLSQAKQGALFPGPSILLGLDGDRSFVQHLATAGDYADLIWLNLAWAAFRAGDGNGAVRAAARAKVSELAAPESTFGASVLALEAALSGAKPPA